MEKKYKTKSYHANKRETQMIQIKTTHTLLKFNFNKLKISGTKLTVPNTSCHFFFSLILLRFNTEQELGAMFENKWIDCNA